MSDQEHVVEVSDSAIGAEIAALRAAVSALQAQLAEVLTKIAYLQERDEQRF